MSRKKKNYRKSGGQLRDMLINLEELENSSLFNEVKKLRKERKQRKVAKDQREKTIRNRNSKYLLSSDSKPKDVFDRLSELQKKLNHAPIGRMTMTYDKNMVFDRVRIKNEEFVPYLTSEKTALMKVIPNTNEPIMEVSIEELFKEFGDEDVVSDMYENIKQ